MNKAKSKGGTSAKDVAAGAVLFVLALDLVVFVVASFAASYAVMVPVSALSFLAIVNGGAWAVALMDDGADL